MKTAITGLYIEILG